MSADPLSAPIMRAATALTVEALRTEIDQVDEQLLALIERRQRLAGRIGAHKPSEPLKLHPAREARVLSRLAELAPPGVGAIVEPVWRELIGAGLAAQQAVRVHVWSGGRDELGRLGRARFGARADYHTATIAEEALDAAADGNAVAVLALRPGAPWWTELLQMPSLQVFDALGGAGPQAPAALVVGRVDATDLARGISYRVDRGRGPHGRLLAGDGDWSLRAIEDDGRTCLRREEGWIGAVRAG